MVAELGTGEAPIDGEFGLGQQEVGVGQLLEGFGECRAPACELVAEAHAHLALYLVLLGQQGGDALGVAAGGLQGVELAAQRCQTRVVAVVDVEVGYARVVGVEQCERLVGAGQRQHVGKPQSLDGSFGRAGELGEAFNLEEFHLVERGVVSQRRERAVQVVQAHQAVAQVDVGLLEFVFAHGPDGFVQTLPLGVEPCGVAAELGVEHLAASGSRHQLHVVDDILEAGVAFYKFFYSHCSIFITSYTGVCSASLRASQAVRLSSRKPCGDVGLRVTAIRRDRCSIIRRLPRRVKSL